MPFFKSHDRQLFYREEGTGSLLLVLPGNTAASAHHQGELNYFGQRFHAVSIDFWGTGQSDRIDGPWPLDWWEQGAHDAAALIAHLGQEQAIVMGTSGGAIVGLLMAILHPACVRAVVADSCVEYHTPERLYQEVQIERKRGTPEQAAFWQYAHGDDWQRVIDGDSGLLATFAEHGADWFEGRLRAIRCPVLLTVSPDDSLLPDAVHQQIAMSAQIPDCRLFLNNGGDHPLMWSRPGDFRRICDYFLNLFTT